MTSQLGIGSTHPATTQVSDGRFTPSNLLGNTLIPLVDNSARRGTRSTSPVLGLPVSLQLKATAQRSRTETLRQIGETVTNTMDGMTPGDVESWLSNIDELHTAFLEEHNRMVDQWPAAFIHHEYFARDLFREEMVIVVRSRSKLNASKNTLQSAQLSAHNNAAPMSAHVSTAKLPVLKLPEFSGDYREWPEF